MVQYIFHNQEISIKVVYYGPGFSGKTTNIEVIYRDIPRESRGTLSLVNTETERTLFFDYLPVNVGKINVLNPKSGAYTDMVLKLRLFTVPGQSYYKSTRKLILKDADGVIFVADSQKKKYAENAQSLRDLFENLKEWGVAPERIPVVFQWNKRDAPEISTIEELRKLNNLKAPEVEAVATQKRGVFQTIKKISEIIITQLKGKK